MAQLPTDVAALRRHAAQFKRIFSFLSFRPNRNVELNNEFQIPHPLPAVAGWI